jgi:hypothetical protein
MIDQKANDKWDEVLRIDLIAEDSLKAGRDAYAETYGVRFDDKIIDAAIQQLFDKARARRRESYDVTVAIPIELILAITLREGFGREPHRRKRSRWRRRTIEHAVRLANGGRIGNIAKGMRKGAARTKAINDAAEQTGVEASIIKDHMGSSRK